MDDEDGQVNFHLERIKASIDSGYITLPNGLSRKEMREWLRNEANRIRQKDAVTLTLP